MTTSDFINACLDFIFPHPGFSFNLLECKGGLSQLIADHIFKAALSHWRQFNEVILPRRLELGGK